MKNKARVKNINEYKKRKKNRYRKRKIKRLAKPILFSIPILDEMKIKILNDSNVTNIEENAKEKLNMDYPKDNQIRYIDLNN